MLKKKVEDMYMDEFIHALAQARFIQELDEKLMTRAIAKAFDDN